MKPHFNILACLLFLIQVCTTNAQEATTPALLVADASWGKEIITFPLDWAPGMDVAGFEELRFAPNWSDSDHDQFWTLAIAYKVSAEKALPLARIEQNFEAYFNGLMHPNHWAQTFPDPVFRLVAEEHSEGLAYRGKLKVYDGFHTGKMISLNVEVNQTFCPKTNQTLVVFYVTPQAFDHTIWDDLHAITLTQDACSLTKS